MPVFSLRSGEDAGIGDTHGLRQFIDFAAEQGIGFVQLLPINEIDQFLLVGRLFYKTAFFERFNQIGH